MAIIIGDVSASSSATPCKIYLILFIRRSKAFLYRKSRFETLQHIKNSGEGFHYFKPPYTYGGGMNLHVRPRARNTFAFEIHYKKGG